MSTKTKVILTIVALATSYAFGRYSAPTKVVTEVKTVEVEKQHTTTDTNRDSHKKTTVTEVTKPDGTKEKTTVTTDDSQTEKRTDTKESDKKASDSYSETTRSTSKLRVSGLIGGMIPQSVPVTLIYGAHVSKNIIGPISLGAFALTNKTYGFSIGLDF